MKSRRANIIYGGRQHTMLKLFQNTEEIEIAIYDAKKLKQFLQAAQNVNGNSSQRSVCKLVSEVLTYKIMAPIAYQNILAQLHKLLSACLESIYNGNYGNKIVFDQLHEYAKFQEESMVKLPNQKSRE